MPVSFYNIFLVSLYLLELDSICHLRIVLSKCDCLTMLACPSKFQLVHPNNKDIRDIPGLGLAPPAMNRKLLWSWNHS